MTTGAFAIDRDGNLREESAISQVMQPYLIALSEKKGAQWASMVNFLFNIKMLNIRLNRDGRELDADLIGKIGGVFVLELLSQRFEGPQALYKGGELLLELMADVDDITDKVVKAVALATLDSSKETRQ
jgi:hypothetical protein